MADPVQRPSDLCRGNELLTAEKSGKSHEEPEAYVTSALCNNLVMCLIS